MYEILKSLVLKNLSIFLFDDAQFYAERLYYQDQTSESLNLLAQCFLLQGKAKQAYLILKDCTDSTNKYMFASICVQLKKYNEAEKCLLADVNISDPRYLTDDDIQAIPGGAAGLYTLGLVCRKQHRKEVAITYFELSLRLDPSLWSSITQLSEMGVKVDAGKIFHTSFEGIEKTMHLKGQHKQQQEPTSNLKKSGRITHQRTVVKSQRMESKDLHNRDLAESTLDSAQSLSLGLSSQLLRIPFASPGGMNIRHHSKETVRHNDDSHFTSPGTNMRKSYSHIQAVDGSYMLPTDSSDVRLTLSETQPRALFDMSHSTITPYLRSFSLNDSAALYPMSEHRPPLAAAANTHRNSIDSSIQDGQAGIHTAMRGAADLPPSHDDYNKPARRVSFGPTARLSFSSMGALDTEPPVQLNSAAPQTTSDDFYPQKVHRIGTSGSNFNQASLLVSPIPTSHSPSAVHTAELTRIKEGDFEDRDDSTASRSHNKIEETVKKVRPDISKPNFEPDVTNKLSNEAWKEFFALMTIFASAYQLAQLYHGQECVRRLKELPAAHFYSGFVYHQLGRAYLEMGDYKAALAALKEMLRLEPHRVKGTEILSTVLWHLKKEKDLCSLAQQIIELDKFAPESWCVVGNCFSLQREPDVAIRYFQRALQVDPAFTYAHTLCGHEFVSNEDLEKATKSFRTAILYDDRHYNAWFGLGCIFSRQEKLELSEYHFRRALGINGGSSALISHLSGVLATLSQTADPFAQENSSPSKEDKAQEAFRLLTSGVQADPRNAQLRFQRAHVLLSLVARLEMDGGDMVRNKASANVAALEGRTHVEMLEEACEELVRVKELSPREPYVYVVLGEVHQKLGHTLEAMRLYNMALDLDPKDGYNIRSRLDSI